MTQTYRTNDGTRWGSGKGSNLTPVEVDINFWDLIQRMETQEARPDPSAGIDYFSITGTALYVHMTDLTIRGPYTLPTAFFNATGDWSPDTVYSVLDTFTINGGLYSVIFAHTSDSSFDAGANDGAGHDYYALMIQTPGSALPTGGAVGMVVEKSTTSDFAVTWGWKLPEDGNTRQYLIKQSNTNQDADWDTPQADDIEFTPVTGSSLTSDNVADVVEELVSLIEAVEIDAADVSYTPSTGSGLTDDNVSDALDTLGTRTILGKQTMWIPATALTARITDGPSSGTVETATYKHMVKTADFDSSTQQFAQFDVAMPKSWDGGDVTYRVFWSHPSTTVNFGVAFGLEGVSISNAAVLDAAFGATVYVNDTGGSTDTQYISDESGLVTVGGSTVFPNLVVFQLCRYPADSGDTLAVNARVHGVQIYYTVNASSDD